MLRAKQASVEFALQWRSALASHVERLYHDRVNFWRDFFPGMLERMGLVLDYFRQAGGFTDLPTESIRGLPRPAEDPYATQLLLADPVYAVWGRAT